MSGKAAHGGVALFWKNCIKDIVTPLENIDSDRIVGIRCDFNDNSPLFICSVYLPAARHPIEEFNEYFFFFSIAGKRIHLFYAMYQEQQRNDIT